MDGQAIAALPVGGAGRRRLPTEQSGPRPGGVDPERAAAATPPDRRTRIAAEARRAPAAKP